MLKLRQQDSKDVSEQETMEPAVFPSINLVAGDSESHSTLSRGESIGLAFDTEAGMFSALAASVILSIIFCSQYKKQLRWEAIQIYVIALFAAEVIQGLGHAVSMKWVIEGKLNTGTFCTAQGIIQQLGEAGVALATLNIAVQTFATIWWLHEPSIEAAFVTVGIQWTFVLLFVAIGFGVHTHPPDKYYATPTPYWCWLGQSFMAERIAGEYIWFWLTLFVSIASYIPLFLLHRGVIEPGPAWYAPGEEEKNPGEEDSDNNNPDRDGVKSKAFSRKPARLWTAIVYPIVYCLVILPCSIIRWISFKQEATLGTSHIPPVVTFIFGILFSLSGILNAVMYPLTRPRIFEGDRAQAPKASNTSNSTAV
jgi:hypothetical protein